MSSTAKVAIAVGTVALLLVGVVTWSSIRDDGEPAAGEVLVVGDSIMNQTAEPLRRQVEKGTVRNEAVNGSGLLTPHLVDWPNRLQRLVDGHDFDAIVLLFVGNYTNRRFWETDDGRVIRDKTDPRFLTAWAEQARRLTEVAVEEGADVFWVLPPPMLTDRNQTVVDRLRGIYQDIADDHDDVRIIDSYEALADDQGGYLAQVRGQDGAVHELRAADGVHLRPHGAQRLADLVADRIGRRDEGHRVV
jgi:hypothetical protein